MTRGGYAHSRLPNLTTNLNICSVQYVTYAVLKYYSDLFGGVVKQIYHSFLSLNLIYAILMVLMSGFTLNLP